MRSDAFFSRELQFAGGEPVRSVLRPRSASRIGAAAAGLVFLVYATGGAFGVAARRTGSQAMRAVSSVVSTRAHHDAPGATTQGPDAARIVETVSHRITADARAGVLVARDDAYTARFAAPGFTLTPRGAKHTFSWSILRAGRAGALTAVAKRAWHATANVATRPVGTAMTERVTARAGHVEWDLLLAHRPAGTGEFVVDANVRHPEVVQLGTVAVRDATRATLSRIRTRVVAGRVSIRVPAAVLDHALYPLTIDPSVTPEVFTSPTPTSRQQLEPAVAFGGTNYLVVWTDERSGIDRDIYGARVSTSGVLLDPTGFPISTAAFDQQGPAIAFDGTNYFVVWTDLRSGTNDDIYGARVAPSGSVLDPNGLPISTAADSQSNPAIAFDGTNYLVAWSDYRSGTSEDLYAARVTTAGGVLFPGGFPIAAVARDQESPAVTFDGTNFFVAWTDYRSGNNFDIYGARVSRGGTVLDHGSIPISTATGDQETPAVAFDGTDDLVVWNDSRSGTNLDVYGARVTTAGAVLDPIGLAISAEPGLQDGAAVEFDGTNCLVVWQDARSGTSAEYGARVTAGGTVLDPHGFLISTRNSPQQPKLAFDGTNSFVVWDSIRYATSNDVDGTRISETGTVLDPGGVLIAAAANDQLDPAIAFDGTDYLTVWDDRRSGVDNIYAARVTKTGVLLDPGGIFVFVSTGDSQFHPAVAFDGTNYLVVWDDSSATTNSNDIYGARINQAGTVLDASAIPISTTTGSQIAPRVAFDGTNYDVVWEDHRAGTNTDIYGTRVATTGTVLDPNGIAISTATGNQQNVAIAFDGTDSLVVWEDHRSGTNADIYGARVTKAGVVANPAGIAISTPTGDQTTPAVTSDGTNAFVVWDDHRSGTSHDIYGTRVTSAGAVVTPSGTPISTAPNDQTAPAVAFNGSYLVVWNDRRTGTDVYGARVDTAGAVTDTTGFAVATGILTNRAPTVSKGDGNKWAVAYQRNGVYGNGIFTRTVAPK